MSVITMILTKDVSHFFSKIHSLNYKFFLNCYFLHSLKNDSGKILRSFHRDNLVTC